MTQPESRIGRVCERSKGAGSKASTGRNGGAYKDGGTDEDGPGSMVIIAMGLSGISGMISGLVVGMIANGQSTMMVVIAVVSVAASIFFGWAGWRVRGAMQ